jgi:hypothetical protein
MNVLDLWMPIVATGLATHVASTIAWMLLPHHRPEWKRHPQEDDLLDWLSTRRAPADQYMFPFCDGKNFKDPEFQQKLNSGPRGMLILWSQPLNMGRAIVQTLGYFFLVAWLIGYLASIAFDPGAEFVDVFRFVFTAGLLTYALGMLPHVFWFPRRYAMEMLDGIVFAAIAAGLFAALWPAAS